jgi:phage terminase Nu1 subunit (DNA packaging protein)
VLDLEAERARLVAAQAVKDETENAVRQGELAPVKVLEFAIGDFAGQTLSIFEGIPAKIKRSLPSLRAREVKILERAINEVRNAVASIQIKFDTD